MSFITFLLCIVFWSFKACILLSSRKPHNIQKICNLLEFMKFWKPDSESHKITHFPEAESWVSYNVAMVQKMTSTTQTVVIYYLWLMYILWNNYIFLCGSYELRCLIGPWGNCQWVEWFGGKCGGLVACLFKNRVLQSSSRWVSERNVRMPCHGFLFNRIQKSRLSYALPHLP